MESGGTDTALSPSSESKITTEKVKVTSLISGPELGAGGDAKISADEGTKKKLDDVSSSIKPSSCPGPSTTKIKTFKPPENWANAPEFVPSWLASKESHNLISISA